MHSQAPSASRNPKTREWLAPRSVERRTSVATLGGTKDDKTANGRRRRSYGSKPATASGDRIVGQGDDGFYVCDFLKRGAG